MTDPRTRPAGGAAADSQKVRRFWEKVEAIAARAADRIANKRRNNVAGQVLGSVVVDSAGHVIAGSAGGGGLTLIAVARGISDTMANDNGAGDYATERCQFNTVSYDPQSTITTGASWLFTPPNAGAMYAVWASVEVGGGSTRPWAVGDYAFLSHNTGGVDICSWQSQAAATGFKTLHCNSLVFDASVTTTFYLNMNVYRSGGGTANTRYLPFVISIYEV